MTVLEVLLGLVFFLLFVGIMAAIAVGVFRATRYFYNESGPRAGWGLGLLVVLAAWLMTVLERGSDGSVGIGGSFDTMTFQFFLAWLGIPVLLGSYVGAKENNDRSSED